MSPASPPGVETQALRDWREQIEREFQRAPHDRHHPWRTPSLSTVDPQGCPQSRTVVLRAADPRTARFRFFTDRRSPKVLEIAQTPRVALLFWNPRSSLQVRIQAIAQVLTHGAEVEAAWARMAQSPSRGDYLSERAPGEPTVHTRSTGPEGGGVEPASPTEPAGLTASGHHLAIIDCRAGSWDALSLSREGHRRAHWSFPDGLGEAGQPPLAQWLTP